MLPERRKKRYICTFVKKNQNGEFIPNVIVIPAHNEILAQAILCETYRVPSEFIKRSYSRDEYEKEGIRTIRLAETNTYEGGSPYENFRGDI